MRTNGRENGPRVRLAPMYEDVAPPQSPTEGGDEGAYDALAELFLGPEPARPAAASSGHEESARAGDASAADVRVEALLMGHLPVMAGPWAGQYALSVSGRLGRPVGLVRLAGGWGSVEVYGEADGGPTRSASTMGEAIARGRELAGRWLVRVDTAEELEMLRALRPEAVTLLTGANEAAVVGGYRTLKEAAGALESEARFGVAVVGAPAERAAETSERLGRTVAAHLGIELDVAPTIPKLEAGARVRLFEGTTDATLGALAGWLAGEPSGEATGTGGAAGGTPGETARSSDFAEPGAYTGVFIPGAMATPPSVQPGIDHAERRATDVLLRAAPVSPREAGAASPARALGLRPIPVVCPLEPTVELAMDSSGAAHLVCASGPRAAESLRAVEGWLREHVDIVARVRGVEGLNADARPTLHIVTRDARSVRGLLDSAVRLHLHVEGAGAPAPLN